MTLRDKHARHERFTRRPRLKANWPCELVATAGEYFGRKDVFRYRQSSNELFWSSSDFSIWKKKTKCHCSLPPRIIWCKLFWDMRNIKVEKVQNKMCIRTHVFSISVEWYCRLHKKLQNRDSTKPNNNSFFHLSFLCRSHMEKKKIRCKYGITRHESIFVCFFQKFLWPKYDRSYR